MRSGTRKDYAEMASVSDADGENFSNEKEYMRDPSYPEEEGRNNDKDGGETIDNEGVKASDAVNGDAGDQNKTDESSDDEVNIAREELEKLKQKRKHIEKQL